MVSIISRRSIQLRAAMPVGCEAIGTTASIIAGWVVAQTQACMPPMELPSTSRSRGMPRPSVTSLCCAATMSA